MAITDNIASIDSGYTDIGRKIADTYHAGEEAKRKNELHPLNVQDKQVQIKQKTLELEEYEADKARRDAERKVKIQEAERTAANKSLLDTESRVKLSENIGKIKASIRDQNELDAIHNFLGVINDPKAGPESYRIALERTPPEQRALARKMFNLDFDWDKDKPKLQYAFDNIFSDVEWLKKLEEVKIKGAWSAASARAGSAGAGKGALPDAAPDMSQEEANIAIVSDMDLNRTYSHSYQSPGWLDDFRGAVSQATSNQLDDKLQAAQYLKSRYSEYYQAELNKQRQYMKANPQGTYPVSTDKLKALALRDLKAHTAFIGMNGSISYLNIQRANARKEEEMFNIQERFKNDPVFLSLPTTRERLAFLENQYLIEQRMRYDLARETEKAAKAAR